MNRGAKMMGAVGVGNKPQKQMLDNDGNPLRQQDADALVMEKIEDVCIDNLLDYGKVGMLGGKSAGGNVVELSGIIPLNPSNGSRVLLDSKKYIESDADEQLLLFFPFTRPVKVLSFLLRLQIPSPDCNPKCLKLYINQPHMDFNDVESITPAHTIELPSTPTDRDYTKTEKKDKLWEFVVQLPAVKFVNTTFLTIFIESNHGAPNTKLAGITFVGRDK